MLNNTDEIMNKIFSFLDEIGITITLKKIKEKTFLPGILIRQGNLIVDKDKLTYPGDLLHEAGHIAVTPQRERQYLNANVSSQNLSNKEGEEIAAILWSYAAAQHINIPIELVFHENGYKGDSSWLITQFAHKNYIGLPLLQWMGLTYQEDSTLKFPEMKKWMRE